MVAVGRRKSLSLSLSPPLATHLFNFFGKLTFLINCMGKWKKIYLFKRLVVEITANHFLDIFV
jgi:hypothetical protein